MMRIDNFDRLEYTISALGIVILMVSYGVSSGNLGESLGDIYISTTQALASIALLWVTARYTKATQENVKLANQRMELELRQDHTETLRDRVEIWLGNKESNFDSVVRTPSNGFPEVTKVAVKSASQGGGYDINTDFRVAPKELEDDCYFDDLLENHATDLNNLKEEIEDNHERFQYLRDEFLSHDFDCRITELAPSQEQQREVLKWVFQTIVLLQRTEIDREKVSEILTTRFSGSSSASETPYENLQLVGEDIADFVSSEDDFLEGYLAALDELESHPAFGQAEEAAEVLDRIEEDCEELERKLIEYRGRLVYPESCEYLEEADINR